MPLPPAISDANVTIVDMPASTYYGYCSIAAVRFELPKISEYPDLATVNATSSSIIATYITYAAQEMQDALALYYVMPYVGTDAGVKLTLRDINVNLAVANLFDHYVGGNLEATSQVAAVRRAYAELLIVDIQLGKTQLATPFGDAVRNPESPTYPRSSLARVNPNPGASDGSGTPKFSMQRSRFRPDELM